MSSFPTILSMAPLVGKDFVIGHGYSPIPHKLANKITSSQFIELADLLPNNLKANESETQTGSGSEANRRNTGYPHLGGGFHHLLLSAVCFSTIKMG